MRGGGSASLVVSGEPGVGKSALLSTLVASASGFRVVRAVGIQGEVDLPYAGLQQLCRPLLDKLSVLPPPQADALRIAFGLSAGDVADPYLVGLAALTLMSEAAVVQPLLCLADDAHWLDGATLRALAFVARRLGADSVGLVFASREAVGELDGVPVLQLEGLGPADARALLDSVIVGHLDEPVRERFLAETHGNPLALIELPRTLTSAEAAAGLHPRADGPLASRIEDSYRQRLELLPDDTRRLLLLAAAEPLGDPLLLLRAATLLGLGAETADAAEETGLFAIRERVWFGHPLMRSAVYGAAAQRERRIAHGALADATDGELDPDREAWHRAQATAAPDEDVAAALERSADRAKSRGGLAAAGAFLERAALLTPDVHVRATRTLAASEVMYEAGAFATVETMLGALDTAQLDELDSARAHVLRARVSLALAGASTETVLTLLGAAQELVPVDPSLGHRWELEALRAGYFLGEPELLRAALVAFAGSAPPEPKSIVELLLCGWMQALKHGLPAGTERLREAAMALRDKPEFDESDVLLINHTDSVTFSLWDFDTWETLTRRAVDVARDTGALLALPRILGHWADAKSTAGDFRAAEQAIAEAESIAQATGAGPDWNRVSGWYIAWHFEEPEALRRLAQVERETTATHPALESVRALVYNGAGQYEHALAAAQRSCDLHPFGLFTLVLPELIEAAVRCGEHERAAAALVRLDERAQLTSTDWGLGLAARCRALLSDDPEAHYREAVERLARSPVRPELGRAHLLYGEWLRRENRRVDARDQLRAAHELFAVLSAPTFTERARRELLATGETARKRTDDTRDDLTAQEAQIARLASEGLTNPEIGAKLFLSPRTVEWHLRRVYPKLGVSSRKELRTVLSAA